MGGHVQCKRVLTSVNTMTNEIANNDPSKYVRWPDIFGIVQCQIVGALRMEWWTSSDKETGLF
jgi:hypothetical protein